MDKINKFVNMNEIYYNGSDLSKATVFDIAKYFPDFAPLLISTYEEINEEKLRVLEIFIYADNYKILDLKEILNKNYKTIYPDIFI